MPVFCGIFSGIASFHRLLLAKPKYIIAIAFQGRVLRAHCSMLTLERQSTAQTCESVRAPIEPILDQTAMSSPTSTTFDFEEWQSSGASPRRASRAPSVISDTAPTFTSVKLSRHYSWDVLTVFKVSFDQDQQCSKS